MKKSTRHLRLLATTTRTAQLIASERLRRGLAQFGPRDSREFRQTQARLKTAADVKEALGNLRGVTLKLAQMAGYLDSRIPTELQETFASFSSSAPTMSWELAQQALTQSIGPISLTFSEIDPVPVAAASIGQVHRATLRDGADVAVKIQFPDAREIFEADLSNARLVTSLLRVGFPSMDTRSIAEELIERIGEELDYRHESAVQEKFAKYYAHHPFIHIPRVYPQHCTDTVLVTEFIDGSPFSSLVTKDQEARDRAGEILFRFVFRSLYRVGLFNGDPHPGNYLASDDGMIAFLDFGFSKGFSTDELALFASMIQAMVLDNDPELFTKIVASAGLLTDPKADPREVTDYFRPFYDLVAQDHLFHVTPEYSTAMLTHTFATGHPLAKALNVPRTFVVLQRINLGLYALLGALGATANWRAIAQEIWPFVDAPPSTALGKQEAKWFRVQHGPLGNH